MKRALAIAVVVLLGALAVLVAVRYESARPACGPGFIAHGTRCCPPAKGPVCQQPIACPKPLSMVGGACRRPDTRVLVPPTHLDRGATDWEAEGLPARDIDVPAFFIDAFEVTAVELREGDPDGARAASEVTRDEALEFCRVRGGRLPTDDEWTAAAGGAEGRRYPWGDTGAVCRRAAWGLRRGPCATSDTAGPDTVGAHADGATATGIHDLAGNVAEWVAADPNSPDAWVRGGSFRSALAGELKTYVRERVDPSARHEHVGFRCAYDVR